MDILNIIKTLSNETRYHILAWLKHPDEHFGPQLHLPDEFRGGVCVGAIQTKAGLAQSVISSYLVQMQKAGLLDCRRYGQWTYYRRNEENINRIKEILVNEL